MSDSFSLVAETRDDVGKGASRRLRRANRLPAIIYGGGAEPHSITLAHNEVMHSLEHEAFYSHILELDVAGKKQQVVLRDLQRHPYKNAVLHVDFQRVKADQEIHMHVPLHFINEDTCIGVKQNGGAISHMEVELNVSCLPKDLPEYIEVDMANVDLGESVHISDIKLPAGVTSLDLSHGEENDRTVATVHGKSGGGDEEEGEGEEAEGE